MKCPTLQKSNPISPRLLPTIGGYRRPSLLCLLALATAGSLCCLGAATALASSALVEPVSGATYPASAETEQDEVILRSGKSFKGKVVSETATSIKFKGLIDGITFETEFSKADVLKVIRATGATTTKPAAGKPDVKPDLKADGTADVKGRSPAAPVAMGDQKKPQDTAATLPGQVRFYWITLEGNMGEEISQTPLREALKDARANNCQTIIVDYRPTWTPDKRHPLPELMANFDEMFRAEPLAEIFTDDLRKDWAEKPRVVFWVKDAMGGGALLPLVCPEVYFASTANIGGLGNLGNLFDGVGDEVVRLKQRSLRMGHAEGWCLAGGYDFRLIRAMAYPNYVLSYRMTDGKPELFEGYPTNPGEELLTDDGKDTNADSLHAILRGTGNDVLTINARLGEILGINRKTVDTKDDLLAAMDIAITGVEVPGRSKNIMKDWSNGLENTKRQLRKLVMDYNDVRVQDPGDYNARTKARGQRRTILEQALRLQKGRFGEGLSQRWLNENNIPGEVDIGVTIEQIKIDQAKDRK